MHDSQVGRVFRAVRIRRGLRQSDVARRAGVDASALSLLERGEIERLSLPMLRRLWAVLGLDVDVEPRVSPADRARLLDAGHAALVERAVRSYRSLGWETIVEFTFNRLGERGAVDIVAWHADHRALSLNEIKTRLPDIQELQATFDRKARVAPAVVGEARGWRPRVLGRFLIVADTSVNRQTVTAHEATFSVSFPARTIEARRWLRSPTETLAALWFLPYPDGVRSCDARRRVRRQVLANPGCHPAVRRAWEGSPGSRSGKSGRAPSWPILGAGIAIDA